MIKNNTLSVVQIVQKMSKLTASKWVRLKIGVYSPKLAGSIRDTMRIITTTRQLNRGIMLDFHGRIDVFYIRQVALCEKKV